MAVKDTLEKTIETTGSDIVTSHEFQDGATAVGAAVVVAATPAIVSAGAVVTGAVNAVGAI
jgi:hypothetical protein